MWINTCRTSEGLRLLVCDECYGLFSGMLRGVSKPFSLSLVLRRTRCVCSPQVSTRPPSCAGGLADAPMQ